ncbi:MAG: lipid-A-disaccharide synthase [Kiloniellaceae bacterium]
MIAAAPGGEAGPLVFLIAGEPSGDVLGARLMAALQDETGGRIRFAGVGGEAMAAQGLRSLVPIEELAVMGLVEVLPHVPRILRRIRQTAAAARAARPAVVVTIDSPNFTLEVAKRLAGAGIPLVHYVAPSVWAWKPWRARRMARYLDHLLVLLPFEPAYFETHGLATTFVGHSALEAGHPASDRGTFRRRHGIAPDAPLLCVLPGSRRGEVRRLAPVFGSALGLLKERFPALRAVVPTVFTVADDVAAAVRGWPVAAEILRSECEKAEGFAVCDAALAASGTVAVELAVAQVPTVIAYRLAPLTAVLARRIVKLRHVSIPNILLGREAQPEFLLERCTAENLAEAVGRLLSDPAARQAQIAACREAVDALDPGGETPSRRAARQVLALIRSGRNRQIR